MSGDPPEGREEQTNKTMQGDRDGASMPDSLFTKLRWITQTAQEKPWFKFRTLAHLINPEMLRWAFGQLRKEAAAGVDHVTAQDYVKTLEINLLDLHQRLRERRYRAQPLRRVYIEKEDGKKRPLSIPVLEDKVVQKATLEILSRIYEPDFLDCSYGYRPGRNAHQAVQAIQKTIIFEKVSYVLEADIQDYFGSIVRKQLMDMLTKRVVDKDILRLIGKWLHVGVIDDGKLLMSEDGTYQGSIISPLLANVYLHEVLDLWLEYSVKPKLRGYVSLVRYADDFVICFQYKSDAEWMQQALPERFAKFGLTLHPTKTRLISFGRFERENAEKENRKPNTFNFLGFTFYCTEDRKGRFTVKSKTMSKRLRRSLSGVGRWCQDHRHLLIPQQWQHLSSVLKGHYNYYGIRANYRSLLQFYKGTISLWRIWLGRRSQRGYISWQKFLKILKKYPLPLPSIIQRTRPLQLELFQDFV